jgi:hypothetical protein
VKVAILEPRPFVTVTCSSIIWDGSKILRAILATGIMSWHAILFGGVTDRGFGLSESSCLAGVYRGMGVARGIVQ